MIFKYNQAWICTSINNQSTESLAHFTSYYSYCKSVNTGNFYETWRLSLHIVIVLWRLRRRFSFPSWKQETHLHVYMYWSLYYQLYSTVTHSTANLLVVFLNMNWCFRVVLAAKHKVILKQKSVKSMLVFLKCLF